ncbi:MAG: PepSY domain-containing protein, partial [Bacteroidales bacterium]|nr:PepSY domain-containing protein [Bacteroidales bacterium]
MSSLKTVLAVDSNTNILYGNAGMWKLDSNLQKPIRYDQGMPETVDQRKIGVMFKGSKGDLFAGSLFGLHHFDAKTNSWTDIPLPTGGERIYSIIENKNGFFVLGRNHLFRSDNSFAPFHFELIQLKEPENYDGKIGAFQTLWQIHNGDIFGMAGRLIMDLVALLFIFLVITGIYHWLAPRRMKQLRLANKNYDAIKKWKRGTKKWHNKLGNWFLILLLISTLTGMFLRPPLLIAIASSKVPKIPFTHLDNPNPWHDRLRAIYYDEEKGMYLIGTATGIYSVDEHFENNPHYFKHQAPISVMGINELSKLNEKEYLVGTFLGLFRWNPYDGETIDYISGEKG